MIPIETGLIVPPMAVLPALLPKDRTAPEFAVPFAASAKTEKFLSRWYFTPKPTKSPPKPAVEQAMEPFKVQLPAPLLAY